MKKHFLSIPFLFAMIFTNAQNVGIDITPAIEKLDVNGNLNLRGNLKVNGVAGSAGQMLGADASGNTAWLNAGDFKNGLGIQFSGTWGKPVGITKIMIEVWGAGGGGAIGGGGASGSYSAAIFDVPTAASTWTISIGTGGSGPTLVTGTGNTGSTSSVTSSPYSITANGGQGATNVWPGESTATGTGVGTAGSIFLKGNSGSTNTETYGANTSTSFFTAIKYGDGGKSLCNMGDPGRGGFLSTLNAGGTLKLLGSSRAGVSAGGGGGSYQSSTSPYGSPGGDGYVIIRW